jgi:hypothetical protein
VNEESVLNLSKGDMYQGMDHEPHKMTNQWEKKEKTEPFMVKMGQVECLVPSTV